MLQTKYIKLRILLLTLALVCIGILVLNGTFATAVDKTTTQQQPPLEEGQDYNVDLLYASVPNAADTSKVSLLGSNGASVFTSNMLWCPGKTEIAYLTLKNNEQFPVEVTLSLNVTSNGFDNQFSYAILQENKEQPTSWTDFVNKSISGKTTLTAGSHELKTITLVTGESAPLTLAIHMEEDTSSEYEQKSLAFVFNLRTDANYEPGENTSSAHPR